MEEKLKNLKEELLNKEITLLNLDNAVIEELHSNSLFDYESDCIEQNSCAYYVENEENEIVVEWEVLKNAESNFDTIVKVTNIWEN